MQRSFSRKPLIKPAMDGPKKNTKQTQDFVAAHVKAAPELQQAEDSPSVPPLPKWRLGFIALSALLTILGGLMLGLYSFVNYLYEAKPDIEAQNMVFEVPRGAGLSRITQDLEAAGLIDRPFIFKLVTKLRGNEANFKAGEYELSAPMSMADIYQKLSEGKAVLYPFTVPEGRTSAQIIRAMQSMETLNGEVDIIPAEGTVLPETYMTPRGMTRAQLIQKMQEAQTAYIESIWDGRQKDLPIKTKAEAINLASIVEKETGIGGERDLVAGVFINRLRKGMKLESDPTIIYGISQGEILRNKSGAQRGLRRSEIDRKTDWNTYQIEGLPKTPICNPGKAAIAAVLNPAKTDAIFFVADGTGGHVFAKTLREHNNNVAKWRKIERARKRKAGR